MKMIAKSSLFPYAIILRLVVLRVYAGIIPEFVYEERKQQNRYDMEQRFMLKYKQYVEENKWKWNMGPNLDTYCVVKGGEFLERSCEKPELAEGIPAFSQMVLFTPVKCQVLYPSHSGISCWSPVQNNLAVCRIPCKRLHNSSILYVSIILAAFPINSMVLDLKDEDVDVNHLEFFILDTDKLPERLDVFGRSAENRPNDDDYPGLGYSTKNGMFFIARAFGIPKRDICFPAQSINACIVRAFGVD